MSYSHSPLPHPSIQPKTASVVVSVTKSRKTGNSGLPFWIPPPCSLSIQGQNACSSNHPFGMLCGRARFNAPSASSIGASLSDFAASREATSPSQHLELFEVCADTNRKEDNSAELEYAPRLTDAIIDETVTPEGSDLHVRTIENACRIAEASLC